MRTMFLAIIGWVTLGMAPALAADLPARGYAKAPAKAAPAYDWSGFYLGLNGGGASSRDHTAPGGLAGGQIGYRWQAASFVFGIEGQGDWANLTGSNASLTALVPYGNQTKVDALGLITGQAGYAWSNILAYAKGGAAVTDNKYASSFSGSGLVFNQASDTRWGGTVGTGIEIGLAPNWSVTAEYDHLFMGKPSVSFPQSSLAAPRSDLIGQGVDMGTVRVNYRFGGPAIPKY
jgi:outer membrane immunogenic protein